MTDCLRQTKWGGGIVLIYELLILTLSLNPESVVMVDGFTRDVSKVGHLGTGDVEVKIRSLEDLERAKPLIKRAYDEN